ncbi:MAG: TrmH family RNA methyltransferase [Patescibacteria group bacterium]|nr:TrmH family RNA methyltransferase [Patescibacteria group bacterium]
MALKKSRDFFVIAHNIRSLYNVGSIFRIADAFGVTKIYLTGYTGRPDQYLNGKKIAKVALGAEKFVPWEYCKSVSRLIKKLKNRGMRTVALENNVGAGFSRPVELNKSKPKLPMALILGEETRGIPKPILKLCDQIIEIPMSGQKESLNVSVAFGIAAFWLSGSRFKTQQLQ